MEDLLPRKIREFLPGLIAAHDLKKQSIFLCRQDGVLLYSKNKLNTINPNDTTSIGALLGGVWQAARALASFLPADEKKDFFRLSFDTSSKGVYILPMDLSGAEYYLGTIYNGELNPGALKSRMRGLLTELAQYLDKELDNVDNDKGNEGAYLFENITDDEMDKLFSFFEELKDVFCKLPYQRS